MESDSLRVLAADWWKSIMTKSLDYSELRDWSGSSSPLSERATRSVRWTETDLNPECFPFHAAGLNPRFDIIFVYSTTGD